MTKSKIAIGSDHGGYILKNKIVKFLQDTGYEITDLGTNSAQSIDYPVIAKAAAEKITKGESDKAILICGTGLGMSIAANKVKGIRAIACSDTCSARYSRAHNNANILCFGERIIGEELAKDICKIWLETDFEGGRHLKRIEMFE